MKQKKLIIIGALLLFSILIIATVNAEMWVCFKKGDKINFCNPKVKDRTCTSSTGCQYCMSNYKSSGNCFNQGNMNVCNTLQQKCTPFGGGNDSNNTIDTKPPVLTVNSPTNNGKYTTKSVLFDLKTDEFSTFYYTDNIKANGAWVNLGTGTSYLKTVNFRDGQNDITIKAVDSNGNPTTKNVKFYVDSTKPKIKKTLPTKGFASGMFEIWFTEANPQSLVIDYGNPIKGRKTANVALSSCTHDDKGTYYCSINVTLTDYNNQNIDYKFKLTDIAGGYVESKPATLQVDTTKPVITNSPIYTVNGKYVTFNLNINEINFDKVSYMDESLSKPSWKSLCTSLKNNVCTKKVTFSRGSHIVDVKVSDDAGNQITQKISFNIDY